MDNLETRSHEGLPNQRGEKGNTLYGYMAVWDAPATIPDKNGSTFTEIIRRGAFAEALKHDVAIYPLHKSDGFPLGRTSSGTLKLREDEIGLAYELTLPRTQEGKTVKALAVRKDLKGCSISWFDNQEKATWTKGNDGKLIKNVTAINKLDHVSIVGTPAYSATSILVRHKLDEVSPPVDPAKKLRAVKLRLLAAQFELENEKYKHI